MARMTKEQKSSGSEPHIAHGAAEGVGSPISNDAYNVLSALHAKLEGLEAYRKYSKDGDASLWQQLTQQDIQSVQSLVGELERLVREDKFRLRPPGKTESH